MKRKVLTLVTLFAIISSFTPVNSHGGRIDSRGGHNCKSGSCAGTYHCHQPLSDYCRKELGIAGKKSNRKK